MDLKVFQKFNHSDKCGVYALFLKDSGNLTKIFNEEWTIKMSQILKLSSNSKLLYIGSEENKLITRINSFSQEYELTFL